MFSMIDIDTWEIVTAVGIWLVLSAVLVLALCYWIRENDQP